MKRSLKYLPLLLLLSLFSCKDDIVDDDLGPVRYQDEFFDRWTKYSDVIYGNNRTLLLENTIDLELDLYEPSGDVAVERPLVILAHSGYFTHGQRTEFDSLCTQLAKRGYLAATVDYRLWEGGIPIDSFDLISVELRAMHDLKAAVRFFKKDAATNDVYRVNPNKIFIGGYSSGAWVALHAAYLNDASILPPFIADSLQANGGIAGNSGHPAYDSKVAGVISLSGALLDRDLIQLGDAPILSIHGDADPIMPYCYGFQRDQLENDGMHLSGPCVYNSHAVGLGIPSVLRTISNGNHSSPFSNNEKLNTEEAIFDFLYDIVK